MKIKSLIACFTLSLITNLTLHAQPPVSVAQRAGQGNSQQPITRRLKIKAKPDAEYASQAKKRQVEGKVILRVVFGADGKIGSIQPVKELPFGLTEKAIEAARLIQFEPEMVAGRPVSKTLNVVYIFKL
jgi:protein TonB